MLHMNPPINAEKLILAPLTNLPKGKPKEFYDGALWYLSEFNKIINPQSTQISTTESYESNTEENTTICTSN